jgi:phage terminase small subunit
MPRGGYRPGAGRKPKTPKVDKPAREPHGYTGAKGEKTADAPAGWPFGTQPPPEATPAEPKLSFKTPLEYWEYVLADPGASASAKAAAAFAMAPYVHSKLAPVPKKEDAKNRAKEAGQGRFKAAAPPLALVKR